MSAETFTAIDEKLSDLDPSTTNTESVLPTTIDNEPLPFWLVNVPRDQWPASCPEFLKEQSDKNIGILATPDEEYQWIGWERVKELVRSYYLTSRYLFKKQADSGKKRMISGNSNVCRLI